jgi:acyl carrier protein
LPGPSQIADAPRTGHTKRTDEVLDVVRTMLVEIIGPEYGVGLTIELETTFDQDLQLESIEFVALSERLPAHYGPRVDFVSWLAAMELDEIIALTVGDLVSFVVASLAESC